MKVKVFTLTGKYNWQHEFILCLEDMIDEEEFLLSAGAKKGTYAGRLMSKIHREIFVQSKNLKKEFEQYFQIEYENFDHYLVKRLFLSSDERAPISVATENSSVILHYKPYQTFLYDDYGVKFLERLMNKKESA